MSKIEIPGDVLEEILARLPAKSLLRFACVSKAWCSLFRNRTFISKHLLNGSHVLLNLSLLSRLRTQLSQKLSLLESVRRLVNLDNIEHPYIVGQCDGLICYTTGLREPMADLSIHLRLRIPITNLVIHLWNPTIREVKILPESNILPPQPSEKSRRDCFGFGHDPKSGDYKVVRFALYEMLRVEAEVYSLRTNSWRSVACSPVELKGRPHFKSIGVCLGGFCYWAGYTLSSGLHHAPMIISYDLANEVFGQYLVLELVRPYSYPAHVFMESRLFMWKGSLTLVMFPSKNRFIDIWSFESGVGSPLTLKEHIDLDQKEHLDDMDMVTTSLKDVEFLWDDDLILTYDSSSRLQGMKKRRTTLKAFNISTRQMRNIFSVEFGSYWFTLQMVGYTPSLVSLLT